MFILLDVRLSHLNYLWQAELTFIHFFSDIRNNYSRYLKKTILDIPKQVRRPISDIQKSYFGYQKQQFRIYENKHLFQISKIKNRYPKSEITIFDI